MRKFILWASLACLILTRPVLANCSFGFLSETLTNAGINAGDVAAGDFNHDGFDDLAIVNRQSTNIAILLGQQGGTFAAPAFVQTSGSTQAGIAAAHINGDDHLDLIATGGELTYQDVTYSGMDVQVLIGNGAGGFSLGDKEWIGYHPADFAPGDFDNDGDTDFAVSRTGNNPASMHLIVNLGGGNIAQKSDTPVLTEPGQGSWLRGIASGDFDGDGNLDVVTSDAVNSKAWIFYGKGDGTFHPPATTVTTTTGAGHSAGYVASADFNGDGFDDIAVANVITGSGITVQPTFVVSLSNGANRTFGAPVSYGTVSGAAKALAHDRNGDGHADVVAGDSTMYIFLGAGNGTFTVRNAGAGFISIGTTPSPSFSDTAAPTNMAVLDKVPAINASLIASAFSATDLTTTHLYTDPTITAGVHVAKRAHLTELRNAINEARAATGLAASSFTNPSVTTSTQIRAAHTNEARTALR